MKPGMSKLTYEQLEAIANRTENTEPEVAIVLMCLLGAYHSGPEELKRFVQVVCDFSREALARLHERN